MNRIKINIIFFLIVAFITGCSSFGTETIFVINGRVPVPKKLGYSQIMDEVEMTNVYDRASILFDSTMSHELSKYSMNPDFYRINDFVGFESINRDSIIQICATNKLDGYIVTVLQFEITLHRLSRKRSDASENVIATMYYFNPNGKLLVHVQYNTYEGETYMDYPKFKESIPDAVNGALTGLFDEIIRSQNVK